MNLLTEIKLKENLGRFNTDAKIDEDRLTVLETRIQEVDPSTKMILEHVVWDWKVEKKDSNYLSYDM